MGLYMKKKIFVFESNLAGRHNKGAALRAYQEYGAIYGQSSGPQGNSYAIPTRDEQNNTLSLIKIERNIAQFLRYAQLNPEFQFDITRIGCEGVSGHTDELIAPMFAAAPKNCMLPVGWRAHKAMI